MATLALALVGVGVGLAHAGPAGAQEPPQPPAEASAASVGRRWPVATPEGCTLPALPDVVFVGTVVDADFQTARYRIDQVRAGDIQPFAYGGLVDVRYGTDTKFLDRGTQYVIGAQVDSSINALSSKVREIEPLFAGDDVIGIAESDVACPQLADPVRTLDTDGTLVDASVVGPMTDAKGDLLRAVLLPLVVGIAIIFGLVALRWLFTGIFKGVGSVVHTASQTREVRSATARRPPV